MPRPRLRRGNQTANWSTGDATRHWIVFLVLTDCPFGMRGQIVRSYLSGERYGAALNARKHGVLLFISDRKISP